MFLGFVARAAADGYACSDDNSNSLEESIRDTRNLIEHLDDEAQRNDRIQKGQNTAPALHAETKTISLASVQLRSTP